MNLPLIKKVKLHDIVDTDPFYKDFLLENNPVLITDVYDKFPKLKNWDMEYLAKKVGKKSINAGIARDDGVFSFNEKTGDPEFIYKNFTMSKYIEKLKNFSSKQKMYAQKISILEELPELRNDISILDYIPNEYVYSANLWVSSMGSTTPLHFDYFNNFFIQLFGEKKIWLYSPKYFYSLYPHSWTSKTPHTSRIDPSNLDLTKYPNALKAEQFVVTIPSGTILFLPSYWWHQVYSNSDSISVNIWCKPSFRQRIVMAHFHSYLADIFIRLRNLF